MDEPLSVKVTPGLVIIDLTPSGEAFVMLERGAKLTVNMPFDDRVTIGPEGIRQLRALLDNAEKTWGGDWVGEDPE